VHVNGRTKNGVEDLLRELAPQVLGVLVRRHGDFAAAEDALQEALLTAAGQWADDGLPRNPRGWLTAVASRRLIDEQRREIARRRREATAAAMVPDDQRVATLGDSVPRHDDTLSLLFLCCHPALSTESQVALTLRAVGGLTTTEIAGAFLVPEDTMTRRISRAKRSIAEAGASFGSLTPAEQADRVGAVLHVLYLIFNEGYAARSGKTLQRSELAGEAIRLTRIVHRSLPDHGEVAGLLALMLLIDARSAARTGPGGELVPLADQDRSRWDAQQLRAGTELLAATLPRSLVGPYQVQASIAAVHAEARTAEDTDWPQILALNDLLLRLLPDNPVVALERAVAVAMVDGPAAGLALLAELEADDRLARQHRLPAVRAHLLELAGEADAARESYLSAARLATSLPERRYLESRAGAL
jgi:RNA polymerase sigma factor (sigma-70 family)